MSTNLHGVTLKDLDAAMDRAFDRCRNLPLDLPMRDAEIRSRYVEYVSHLECLVRRLVRDEHGLRDAVNTVDRAAKLKG